VRKARAIRSGDWYLRIAVALPLAYEVYRLLRGTFSAVLTPGQAVDYYVVTAAQDWGPPVVFAAAIVLLLIGSRGRLGWIAILVCSFVILALDIWYDVSMWGDYPYRVPLSIVLDVSLIMVALWSLTNANQQHRTSAST
jgi:hypothetical protein